MPRILYTLTLFVGAALAFPTAQSGYFAPLHVASVPAHDLANDSYIVSFREDIEPSTFSSHLSFLKVAGLASPLHGTEEGLDISHVYNSEVTKGYAGKFSPDVLDMIRRRPEVEFVEQDQYAYATDVQANPPWGLARISHRNRLLQKDVHYNYERSNGHGVTVYVIDTGVYTQHTDFYGRARWAVNFAKGSPNRDETGHGTHVAGTIASWTYGVAKSANIVSLKVLAGPNGRGLNSDIIAAINWAVADARRLEQTQPQTFKGAVINMSLSSGRSRALDDAANRAVNTNVPLVAAAGNDNVNACSYSPAAAALPITVGATNIRDNKAGFSNWGNCVDVLAPGEQILSTAPTGPQATQFMSGTSMATPHVAGLLANFLSLYPHWSFNPRLMSAEPERDSALLTAYTAAYSALPELISGILPHPTTFDLKTGDTLSAQNFARPYPASRLKQALLALASRDKITPSTLPAGTPNLLIYNNMTHTHLQEFENFWDEY